MDRFLGRSEKLLIYLCHKAGAVSISELAEYLQVGQLTVEKDLQLLEDLINSKNIYIKDRKVYLNTESSLVMDHKLYKLYQNNLFFEIIVLLFNKKLFSIQQLANFLNISKATTYRKCKLIKKWLEEYNIELVTSPKCEIKGNELNIRNLMQQFYDFYLPRSLEEVSFFDKEYFLIEIGNVCRSYGYKLKSQSLRKLTILLEIMHIRSRSSNYITYSTIPTEGYSEHINMTKKLAHFFPNYIDQKTKQSECIYFAINMFNYIKSDTRKEITIEEIYFSRENNIRYNIIFEFLQSISRNFYFDFASDIKLVEQLNTYTEMYYIDLRLGTNNRLNNLTGYINVYKDHPFYLLIKKVALKLFKVYDFLPDIKEIDIFTLYLLFSTSQLRIRKKQVISIAIVCESEFELDNIMSYLELKFSLNVNVYPFTSYDFKTNLFYQKYDLILYTGNITSEPNQTEKLKISPILSKADKKNIDCKIDKMLDKKMTKFTELLIS